MPGTIVASRSRRDRATVTDVPQPKRRATYEDLMQVPDTKVAEIIDGELFVSPRPGSPHAFAATVLGTDLVASFHRDAGDPDGPGGWWLLLQPEIHFGEDVVVPDWAGWRREQMPTFPDAAFFTLAPDWVCEVVSPSTGRLDRTRKMGVYGRDGVANLWLVDPLSRTLEIYRLEGGRWVVVGIHAGDDVIRAEPFAAIDLRLARWWPPAA
jgi:Uma2 family endonuclease